MNQRRTDCLKSLLCRKTSRAVILSTYSVFDRKSIPLLPAAALRASASGIDSAWVGRLAENQTIQRLVIPARNRNSEMMVVISPAENVAAWHGMHRILFGGSTMAAAPTGFP